MIAHEKEYPTFRYCLSTERQILQTQKYNRNIPNKSSDTLLGATWNLTNFGLQKRTDDDIALMAEIISWFDLIAIQELADDLTDLRRLMKHLPSSFKVILSDVAGNYERAGFIYDSEKVERLELAAEIAVPPHQHRYIQMSGISGIFKGFDRNPYAVAFRVKTFEFIAVSVHLYYGGRSYKHKDRRALEAYALARWSSLRHKAKGAYSKNILIYGDFNLDKPDDNDKVYKALKKKGLILPTHSCKMGSNLASDKHYDQVAFHTGGIEKAYTGNSGVFDFDSKPFFEKAWEVSPRYFNTVVKHHIADHRPLWAEFAV